MCGGVLAEKEGNQGILSTFFFCCVYTHYMFAFFIPSPFSVGKKIGGGEEEEKTRGIICCLVCSGG
jgi:hypothetical protein